MSERPPFGFTGGDDPEPASGTDPFAAIFGGAGQGADLGALLHRLGDLLSWRGGPVNWDLAREVAGRTVQEATPVDATPTADETAAVEAAIRLAELWLDDATTFPAGAGVATAWSRAQWVEGTLPAWTELTEPVAGQVVAGMNSAIPTEMAAMAAPIAGVLGQVGGMLFGAQVGQAIGTLAGEVVGSTDVGLPLGPTGTAALLPAGVAAFGEGLEVPLDEVRLYLALREAAYHRLYAHVPWLRAHVVDAVAAYARGIKVDTDALEAAVRDLDPSDPEALQRALAGGPDSALFNPAPTPEQEVALGRLETALALVEGWVDDVVASAAQGRLPAAGPLRETVRRRRAVGGPAEQTFATLVGLELRPRRLREAAALWAGLRERRGIDGREAVWGHPDLMPGADDLADPTSYLDGSPPFDISGLDDSPAAPDED